jgi:serine/threonine-protein kinase
MLERPPFEVASSRSIPLFLVVSIVMKTPEPGISVGPYELAESVGEGATGRVFRAEHSILERSFAIKFLRERDASRDHFRKRFLREAKLASQLSHDHLVEVVGANDSEWGLYIVMEYLESTTLEAVVDREGPLRAREAVEHVTDILDALHCVHEQDLLHRDVKAGNVLLAEDGHCALTDFGLVRRQEGESRLTSANGAVGTPFYMPPEQWSNDSVDRRTDVFAAGVLLYRLVTARFPFPGTHPPDVLDRLDRGPADPLERIVLPNIPERETRLRLTDELDDIVGGALQRDRRERYETARAFARDLEQWLERAEATVDPEAATSPSGFDSEAYADSLRLSRFQDTSSSSSSASSSSPSSRHQESSAMPDARDTTDIDLVNEPVEIADNVYWVGKRPRDEIFYANPYLRHFPGDEGNFNLLVDPGSSKDFGVVQSKISRVVGGIENISAVFINHQDPDVGSATGQLLGRYTPDAHVLCTEDTWRLVHYYNIPGEQVISMDDYVPNGAKLPTGDSIVPVPSPFCHFVGAMMLYDPKTRVLFSGDLFGGLTDRDAEGLFADESDWTGMRAFHQIYMPTNKALTTAIENIRELEPAPEVIAPQHGRVIRGRWVEEFMGRLEELPVGLDVHDERFASDDELRAWSTVLNRVVETARDAIDEPIDDIVEKDPQLRGMVTMQGGDVEITSLGKSSVERAIRLLCAHVPEEMKESLKYEAVFAAGELDLPTPSIELEEEGGEERDNQPKKDPEGAILEPEF